MKAEVRGTLAASGAFVIRLIPESDGEREQIKDVSLKLNRSHMINSRGFKYMESDVEFYVQPTGRSD